MPLIYSVLYEEKSKILLFKSNVEIQNTCDTAIDILFETDPTVLQLESKRSVVSIPPSIIHSFSLVFIMCSKLVFLLDSTYSVPIHLVKEALVRVAPGILNIMNQ